MKKDPQQSTDSEILDLQPLVGATDKSIKKNQ